MKPIRKPYTNLALYSNIKKYRELLGLSQDELAKRTGYTSRSSIAKIEKGLVDLPQTKIALFADVFGVSIDDLLGTGELTTAPEGTFSFPRLLECAQKEHRSISYLCMKVGKANNYIADLRRLDRQPAPEYVELWADLLSTTPEYLLCLTDDPTPTKKAPTESKELPASVRELHSLVDELTEPEAAVLLAALKASRAQK